jgi:hypothetical protein
MTPDDFEAADANLIASMRAPVRWQGEPAELREEGGLLLCAGVRRFPAGYVNCAARLERTMAPSQVLGRAAAYFADRDRGFSLCLRDPIDEDLIAAAGDAGMVTISSTPWMTLDRRLPDAPLPAGVELRFAGDDARVIDDAVTVRADAYESMGLPAAITLSLFGARAPDPLCQVVVAYVDGAPGATAQLLVTDGVAGIFWVATLRTMRGRGLAEACTRAVTNAGFAAGARFAALQASHMGAPIYTRMGYQTRWQCRWVMMSREQARATAMARAQPI